jgi:hypothetical protein
MKNQPLTDSECLRSIEASLAIIRKAAQFFVTAAIPVLGIWLLRAVGIFHGVAN